MAKKRKRAKNKRAFRLKLKKATVFSIAQITFFSLAGLVIISFARQGLILVKLNDFLLSYFSWATIFLPFIFLSFAFLVSKFKIPLAQPNVLVGSLLFFVSIVTITRAGILGKVAWDGIAGLITGVGAFIVLLGTSIVGLIILFNTSVDQVVALTASFVNQVRGYLFGEKALSGRSLSRKQLKVSGGSPAAAPASRPEPGLPSKAC
jgi:hypothetical protein